MKIYIVLRNSDTIELKGRDYIKKIFNTKEKALNYIKEETGKEPEYRHTFDWADSITERYEYAYSIQIYTVY